MGEFVHYLAEHGVVEAQRLVASGQQRTKRRVRKMEATMLRLDGFNQREIAKYQGCSREMARLRVEAGAHFVASILGVLRDVGSTR